MQLLWVDYTSTVGAFPPCGEPPDFQAIRTTLQVQSAALCETGSDFGLLAEQGRR